MIERIGFLTTDDRLRQALRGALGRLPASSRRGLVLEGRGRRQRVLSRLLIVSWAEDLPVARLHPDPTTRWEGHIVLVRPDTPAEVLSSVTRLRVQDPSRLQFVTVGDLEQARSRLEAFVRRLAHADEGEGILHAWWAGDSLEILTTAFRRVGVPRAAIGPLRGASADECRDLEVAHDGSHVAWPPLDVHLGFERIEELVAPERALRSRQRSDAFNRRYGAAIRRVRRAHELRQSGIPGLSPRHVGRIERGEVRATSKALRVLARAHALSEREYLEQVAAAQEPAR